jgi:hypothetical protein
VKTSDPTWRKLQVSTWETREKKTYFKHAEYMTNTILIYVLWCFCFVYNSNNAQWTQRVIQQSVFRSDQHLVYLPSL